MLETLKKTNNLQHLILFRLSGIRLLLKLCRNYYYVKNNMINKIDRYILFLLEFVVKNINVLIQCGKGAAI